MEDVKTLNDMADLSKMVYSEYSYRAWIGLHDDMKGWRWSMSDKDFYKNDEAEFRNWEHEESSNSSREHCVQMNGDGLWQDYPCDDCKNAVCSNVRGQNVTFVFNSNSTTWTEAQSYCRAHYTDLASVRNMSENQKVKEVLPAGQSAWIGLFRDSWKWTDGSNFSFIYWKRNETNDLEGNNTCVAANFESFGKWEHWNCDRKTAFVCYSDSGREKRERSSLRDGECQKREVRRGRRAAVVNGMDCVNSQCIDPCQSYTIVSDTWRSINNTEFSIQHCDQYITWQGWYRLFLGQSGARIPERCIESIRCGTHAPLWITQPHPTQFGEIVTRTVCNNWNNDCCYFRSHTIQVKRCPGNYYVYKLVQPLECHLPYCAEVNTTDAGFAAPDATCEGRCYKQVVRMKLEKKSDLDLNNAAVMESMLNQLQQKLKDQGVNGDVKLSWRKQPDGEVFHEEEKETNKIT